MARMVSFDEFKQKVGSLPENQGVPEQDLYNAWRTNFDLPQRQQQQTLKDSRAPLKDAGASLLGGVNTLAGGVYSLADMATGGSLDKSLDRAPSRFFEGNAEAIDDMKSPYLQAQQASLQEVEGFLPTAKELLTKPYLITNMTLESIPSFAPGIGAAAKFGKAASASKFKELTEKGMDAKTAARESAKQGAKAGATAAIGADTAYITGLTYGDRRDRVAGMTNEELAEIPGYAEMSASGMTDDEIRDEIANDSALTAAAIVAPISALSLKLSGAGKFLGDLGTGNLGQSASRLQNTVIGAGRGVTTETPQELVQSGAEVFGANVSEQQFIDPTQRLDEGLPEALATGAIVGGAAGGSIGAGGGALQSTDIQSRIEALKARQSDAQRVNQTADQIKQDIKAQVAASGGDALDIQTAEAEAGRELSAEVIAANRQAREMADGLNADLDAVRKQAEKAKLDLQKRTTPFNPQGTGLVSDVGRLSNDLSAFPQPDMSQATANISSEAANIQPEAANISGQEDLRQSPQDAINPSQPASIQPSPNVAPVDARPIQQATDPIEPSTVDLAATEAALSPTNNLPEPTEAQKEAGNYKIGRVKIAGLDISIENPKGSVRKGTDKSGTPWANEMQSHYGYVRGSVGRDKDHVDVFLGDESETADKVFVIDQVDPDTGKFDEHKVMIGYPDEMAARSAYAANYNKDWKGLGNITEMPMTEFKSWVKNPKLTSKPITKIPQNLMSQGFAAGRKSSLDGMPREIPEYITNKTGKNAKDWLKGWDSVQSAARGSNQDRQQGIQSEQKDREASREDGNAADPQTSEEVARGANVEQEQSQEGQGVALETSGVLSDVSEGNAENYKQTLRENAKKTNMKFDGKSMAPVSEAVVEHAIANKRRLTKEEVSQIAESNGVTTDAVEQVANSQGWDRILYAAEQGNKDAIAIKNEPELSRQPKPDQETQTADNEQESTGILPDNAIQENNQSRNDPPIEDFGQKIEGARKDFASKMAEAKEKDIASVPLSESWPQPDYQKLIDMGADPVAVGFARAVREEIPSKPRASWKLKGWSDKVREMRGLAESIVAGEITMNDVRGLATRSSAINKPINKADLYAEFGHDKSLKGIKFYQARFAVLKTGDKLEKDVNKWLIERPAGASNPFSNMPYTIASADTKQEAIEQFRKAYAGLDNKKKAKSVRFDIYTSRRDKSDVFIGKKIGSDTVRIEQGFKTVAEARKYLAENQQALEQKLDRMKDVPAMRRETNNPRVGIDHRNGGDVTPEQFSEAFAFKGVQFGNYVEQSRRQEDLNDAYDALMDLAGILNVPPKALSLNGELGLAFGARGKGGKRPAAAHYEAGNIVINLTKKSGAGSLAHEWWHSLDNYFSRKGGAASKFVTDNPYRKMDGVRPEMLAAFKEVNAAINRTMLRQRSAKLDATRTKPYWSTDVEMSARSFESYVIEKLRDQNVSNDYLANIVGEDYWNAAAKLGIEKDGTYPYPEAAEVPEIRGAFDNFFNVVETRETDTGVELYSFAGQQSNTADRLQLDRTLVMEADGRDRDAIRKETGWFRGEDGKLRYEISDDKAALDEIAGNSERIEVPLSQALNHPALLEAYPDLQSITVFQRPKPAGETYRGVFYEQDNLIELDSDLTDKEKLSVLLHEVQHAIQARENFARGGNSDERFTDSVRQTVSRLSDMERMRIDLWKGANDDLIAEAEQAAEIARYALMYESVSRLIDHANRERPSSQLRNLRNEMQWVYQYGYDGDQDAKDIEREWYALPKRHKMRERNEFLRDIAMRGANYLRDQIPNNVRRQFKNDPRQLKSMIKALQREAAAANQQLQPLRDQERRMQSADSLKAATEFKSPHDIYRALSGEIEARNVQARQNMTEQERQDISPERTRDVPRGEAIIVFGGLEMAVPMASQSEAVSLSVTQATETLNRDRLLKRAIDSGKLKVVQSADDLPIASNILVSRTEDTTIKYESRINELLDGAKPKMQGVKMLDRSDMLSMLGMSDGPVYIVEGKVSQGRFNHRLTPDQWKKIPEWLDSPAAVFDSETVAGRLVFIAPDTVDGKLVRLIIDPRSDGSGVNLLINAYEADRNPISRWVEDGLLRYADERKTPDLERSGLQLPRLSSIRGYGKKIHSGKDLFKYRQENKLKSNNAGSIQGAYKDGTAYIVADGNTVGTLKQTAFHELTHAALDTNGDTFIQPAQKEKLFKRLDAQVRLARNAKGDSPLKRAIKRTEQAGTSPDKYMEEIAGYLVTDYVNDPNTLTGTIRQWVQDFIAAIQAAVLRYSGIQIGKVTGAELSAIARAYADYVTLPDRGRGTAQNSDSEALASRGDRESGNPDSDSILFSQAPAAETMGPSNFAAPEETLVRTVIRTMQDKFKVLKDLEANIKEAGGAIDESNDTYRAEELFHGKAENDIRLMKEQFVEPMAKMMAKFDIDQDALDQYLIAKHAPERNKQIAKINPAMPDGGSGMTNAEAKALIAEIESDGLLEQYEQTAGLVYELLQTQRDMIRSAGLESDGLLDTWEESYQFYVPLKGWKDETEGEGMPISGSGFNIGGRESRRALGRSSEAASPSSFAISDTTKVIIRKRKNEVGNALLKMIEDNPNKDYWQIFTEDNPETDRRIVRVKDPETGKMVDQVRETVIPMAMMRDRYFTTKKDGQTYYMKLEDPRLMTAMKNLGPETNGVVIRTLGGINRILSALNTSYSPEFVVSNFSRDVQTAILNLSAEQSLDIGDGKVAGEKIIAKTIKNVPTAMRAIYASLQGKKLKGGAAQWQQWFDEFRADGAKTGYFDMKDLNGQSKELQTLISMAKGDIKGNSLRFAKSVAGFVENINQSVENAVRLSMYVNAIQAGISRSQASSLAKNATVNFNRKGQVGTLLNSLYMFANASIQGTANFARTMATLKGDKSVKWKNLNNAQKIAFGIMAGSFFMGMANRMAAGEDDDGENWYDKIPDYVKERNLVIMKSMFGGDANGEYWKIPLPYGYNIFAVAGVSAEAITIGDKSPLEASGEMTLAALGSFSPIGFQESSTVHGAFMKNAAPTVIKPIVDISLNENFMGSSIYSENLPFGTPKPNSSLARRSTPLVYRELATWMNEVTGGSEFRPGAVDVNPDVFNYFLDYFGGSAFQFFGTKTPEFGIRTFAGIEFDENRTPFLSRISGRVMHYDDTDKFYNRRNEINQIDAERKSLTGPEQFRFSKENRDKLQLKSLVKRTERKLKGFRQERDAVYAADISLKMRDIRLKEIERKMKAAVDEFNRAYGGL